MSSLQLFEASLKNVNSSGVHLGMSYTHRIIAYTTACFNKKSTLHIWPKNFWTVLPQNFTFYLSKILMTFL